jgi:uncharacterized protein YciI
MPKEQFICFLEPARDEMPDNPTPQETELVNAHFAYYQGLHKEGSLILAGRTLDPPHVGIMIFEAEDMEHAESIIDNDPGIAEGVFNAHLQEYRVALIRD